MLSAHSQRPRGSARPTAITAVCLGFGIALGSACLVDCGGTSFTSTSTGGTGGSSGAGDNGGGAEAGGGALGGGGSAQGGSNSGGHGGRGHAGSGQGGSGQGGTGQGGGSVAGSPPVGGSGGSNAGGTSAGGAGAGGAGAGSGGTGGGSVITACPKEPPTSMSACQSGLDCTYGDDVRLNCRAHYTCKNGAFVSAVSFCKPLGDCIDRAGGIPHPGDTCTAMGEECLLQDPPNYIYCRCDSSWVCAATPSQVQSSCPQVAPNLGQACETSAISCQYGSCSFPAAYDPTLQCKDKLWTQITAPCATPGGG